MGPMIDKTRDKMNNSRWDNPHAFGDIVNRSNLQTTSTGKIKHTGDSFSWYGSDDGMEIFSYQAAGSTSQVTSWLLDD